MGIRTHTEHENQDSKMDMGIRTIKWTWESGHVTGIGTRHGNQKNI